MSYPILPAPIFLFNYSTLYLPSKLLYPRENVSARLIRYYIEQFSFKKVFDGVLFRGCRNNLLGLCKHTKYIQFGN
jgi:hypothetical protein